MKYQIGADFVHRKSKAASRSGYLMIELLLAVMLAATGFVFLNQLLNGSLRLHHDTVWEQRATQFGSDIICYIRTEAMHAGAGSNDDWRLFIEELTNYGIPLALGGDGDWRAWGGDDGIETNATVFFIADFNTRQAVVLEHFGYNLGARKSIRKPVFFWYSLSFEPLPDEDAGGTNRFSIALSFYREPDRDRPRVDFYAEIERN